MFFCIIIQVWNLESHTHIRNLSVPWKIANCEENVSLKRCIIIAIIKNLGRTVRISVTHCDMCQRGNNPNRSFEIEARAYLPSLPGEIFSVDLYTPRLRNVKACALTSLHNKFFFNFPIYLQSVYIHLNTISKLCVEMRGRVEECSVAPLRDKRVKTLCGWLSGKESTN
jgi:hypothetical protein